MHRAQGTIMASASRMLADTSLIAGMGLCCICAAAAFHSEEATAGQHVPGSV